MESNEINDVAPTSLAHLIGQRSVVEQVRVALDSAQIDGLPFPGGALLAPNDLPSIFRQVRPAALYTDGGVAPRGLGTEQLS